MELLSECSYVSALVMREVFERGVYMRQETCCFTGHRDFPPNLLPVIRRQTVKALEKLITENVFGTLELAGR